MEFIKSEGKRVLISLLISVVFFSHILSIPYLTTFFILLIFFFPFLLIQKYVGERMSCRVTFGFFPGHIKIREFKFGRWKGKRRRISKEEKGKISLIQPLLNFMTALLFLTFEMENLTLFNLILTFLALLPLRGFCGREIVIWKPVLWVFLLLLTISLLSRGFFL